MENHPRHRHNGAEHESRLSGATACLAIGVASLLLDAVLSAADVIHACVNQRWGG
jgi:hypothetical protein